MNDPAPATTDKGEVNSRPVDDLAMRLGTHWDSISWATKNAHSMRRVLADLFPQGQPADSSLVVFGSLARDEFTSGSDIDWTLLIDGPASTEHFDAAQEVAAQINKIAPGPGREGTFGGLAFSHDLVHLIGGSNDSNRNMTQRTLLLFESAPIGHRGSYDRTLRNVFKRYIVEDYGWVRSTNPRNVPRFLQNDIARYWRTVAVDFAYKRRERAAAGWALRTAKLRLSRKLTYAAGLLACFRCAEMPQEDHVPQAVIDRLLSLRADPPLQAVARTLFTYPQLDAAANLLFSSYDAFLSLLDDQEKRAELASLAPADAAGNATFEQVRELGHTFQKGLDGIFLTDNSTPFYDLTKIYGVF